ncbi:MAG: hypothetical protein IJP62_10920 [Treponema sp.]|nr:hypothetical protein [Treponema sp.]
MKITKKLLAFVAASVFAASSVFALDASVVSDGLEDFSDQLNNAIPQGATQQNVWADAWIGSLLPGIHLGGGINVGLTNLNTEGLSKAGEEIGIGGIGDSCRMPMFTADLRIGGIFLPFDADIAIMKTPSLNTNGFGADMSVDFFTLGFDVRYAVVQGNLILPKVSVGLGYFYNQGKVEASSSTAEASLEYKIHTLYLSAQVSKEFSIPVIRLGLTPFLGGRLFVSKHDNNWDWALKGLDATAKAALDAANSKYEDSGSDASSGFDFNSFQPQIFAGVGVNFALLQLTASISIDPRTFWTDKLWTGAISLRVRH